MATLAPMNPPARQPLGAISGARLRNLGHVKNKQNGKESVCLFIHPEYTIENKLPPYFNHSFIVGHASQSQILKTDIDCSREPPRANQVLAQLCQLPNLRNSRLLLHSHKPSTISIQKISTLSPSNPPANRLFILPRTPHQLPTP